MRSTSSWQRVSYQGIELQLPQGLQASSLRFEGHGHQEWDGKGLNASLSFGYFGLRSFDGFEGQRCRTEIIGQTALVIEQVSRAGASITVWIPKLHLPIPLPYHVFVTARSPRSEDVPLLRTIAWSMKMAEP
jgi:hypothetical protein